METIYLPLEAQKIAKPNYLHRFLQFAEEQQSNSFGWLAAAFLVQGCVMAPITILSIVTNGNPIELWMACILAFTLTEIVCLSAMPTKITIPFFAGGIVVDMLVIAISFLCY